MPSILFLFLPLYSPKHRQFNPHAKIAIALSESLFLSSEDVSILNQSSPTLLLQENSSLLSNATSSLRCNQWNREFRRY
ncbi:hypothetical protein [Helicobacter cholecystus]|uniref:hypothetical protein n=1 Tax=Helicobacter cholecystus TaxID=45498 RepID=UPI0027399827|nr:hypothetical protein [Helicobacter cholecystus]